MIGFHPHQCKALNHHRHSKDQVHQHTFLQHQYHRTSFSLNIPCNIQLGPCILWSLSRIFLRYRSHSSFLCFHIVQYVHSMVCQLGNILPCLGNTLHDGRTSMILMGSRHHRFFCTLHYIHHVLLGSTKYPLQYIHQLCRRTFHLQCSIQICALYSLRYTIFLHCLHNVLLVFYILNLHHLHRPSNLMGSSKLIRKL